MSPCKKTEKNKPQNTGLERKKITENCLCLLNDIKLFSVKNSCSDIIILTDFPIKSRMVVEPIPEFTCQTAEY